MPPYAITRQKYYFLLYFMYETNIADVLIGWDDTMRGEAARLISARMANQTERKIYYGE